MYKKKHFKNGLTAIVSPMPQMTSVSLGIWVGVGGRYESEKESGISHVVEHMLFKGTQTRTTKELKQSIEGVGGSFNGFTTDEVTSYMVKVPEKHLELGMDVLTDMVFNARIDEEDILKEKFVISEEINMYRDQPADHVHELLGGLMWPGNPLGRPLTGTIKTVKSFKRDDIVGFKGKNYHPGNIAVIAAGKVSAEKLFASCASKFAGQKKGKNQSFKAPKIRQKGPGWKYQRRPIKQSHIAMGFHAVDKSERERFALKLMNIMLGGNMSSRLFEELREKYGLCYDISSAYKRHSDVGEVVIHSGVDNRNAFKSVAAILDELRKIRDMGVTRDEFARAKEFAKGQFLLAMENTSLRMLWLGERSMVFKKIPEVKDILKKLEAVTIDDVKKVCEKIFRPSSVNLAIIGDVPEREKNKIRKELDRL